MRRLYQPDPDQIEIEEVRCFGCGRKIGVTAEVKMEVFCDEQCWYKNQVINLDNAARNRALVYLVEHGVSKTAAADAFDLTRARILQIIDQGNEGDYLEVGRRPPTTNEERAARSRAGQISAQGRWSSPRNARK